MRFMIEPEIFDAFPGLRIVVAEVRDIQPVKEEEELSAMLKEAWRFAGEEGQVYGNPQSHPNIIPWAEAMKAVGAPRKKFPSSIESMVRRAGKSSEPFHIQPVVDFYNAVSLKHIVPAGGYDLDALHNDMCLRFSREGDHFTALDSDESADIPAGEASYADGNTIITRHFVWKQSKHGILRPESKNILFVSEILKELPEGTAEKVVHDFSAGLSRFFGVQAKTDILDQSHGMYVCV